MFHSKTNAFDRGSVKSTSSSSSSGQTSNSNQTVVPWDYKIEEKSVGDLINGDMTILPDNQLLANDDNYATGDKIWTLSYMYAEMNADKSGKTNVVLSPWKPIKSYKTKDAADKDLLNLKDQIDTQVDLVGVYKTEDNGKFREFAVITLPTGNDIKQPISEERYASFKSKKKVKVSLEEVHNYENYDDTMAKFRGWGE
ncbi:MAG: hypothetical protein JWM44_639 [Bacilli bacterium]|nr:hypothetical protein [Bacilli bacterium]